MLFYIIGLVGLFLPDAVCGADPDICPRCGQSDCEYMAGINLAGAEFGRNIPGVEGRDYGWPKIEELDYWQSKGIRLVRLPFMWERLQPVLNEAFDAGYLAGLEQTVMRMGRRNMLVILDVHNYARYRGELIGSVAVPTAAFGDLWGRLSTIFEDNPAVYGYGLMNEPGACDWAAAAQAAIDAIRQKDAATRIYVANDYPAWAATYATGDLAAWAERKMPIGNPNILHDPSNLLRWELHVYLDHDASGTYHNTYQFEIERTDGPGARVGPELGIRRAKPFVEWLKKYNQKGFIGEYSAPANPGVDSRWLYALRNTMGYFREHCLASTYWGAGERFYDGTDTVISENGWIVAGGERPQLKLLLKYSASDIPEIETCSNRLDDGMGFIADVSGPAGVPDCYVDIYDLAVFLVNWLDCNNFQDTTCMSK
ncbi:MAG: cellulase family glycosylhydrolase [Sedimentisphaerales bacterium]|nr:cellulase family glycosylhydrolase [Sedimentisphaerales bacterium]